MVYQLKQEGYSNEDISVILNEDPNSEEGILQNDALYEIDGIDMSNDMVEQEVARVALEALKALLEKVDENKELKEEVNNGSFIICRETAVGPLYFSGTKSTTFNKDKAVKFSSKEEAAKAKDEYLQSVKDPEVFQFEIVNLDEGKALKEDEEKPLANESETFKNISDTLVNYDAFVANYGPIVKVLKFQSDYLIYRTEAKNYDEFIYKADNKDEIEGWLYGCVMVANGIIKPE